MTVKLTLENLARREEWAKLGVALPAFDVAAMRRKTKEAPTWVHFGAGNIFRAFIAALQQRLLNEGLADRGIIAADTFDVDNIRLIYGGYDNLIHDHHAGNAEPFTNRVQRRIAPPGKGRSEFFRHFPRQRKMLRLRLVSHCHDDCVLVFHRHVLLNIFAKSPPVNRRIVGLPWGQVYGRAVRESSSNKSCI